MTPLGTRNLQTLMNILESSGSKGIERLGLLLAGKPLPNQLGAAENSWASRVGTNLASKFKQFAMTRKKRGIANGNNDQEMGTICDTETTGNPMAIDSNELYNYNTMLPNTKLH
jgi:hypothetical protein